MNVTYPSLVLIIAVVWLVHTHRAKRKYPPGPPRLPFIGSANYMPLKNPWLVFSKWNKTYGALFQLDVLGNSIVVINSMKIAKDLLGKRSSIYSDRPNSVMSGKLVGFGISLGFLPYGETWRKQRRMVVQDFSPKLVTRYHSLQENQSATLIHSLLKDPEAEVRSELQFRIGIIILRVTYGYTVETPDDQILKLGLTVISNFSQITVPGKYIVDLIPMLQYFPSWAPGMGFLKEAQRMRAQLHDIANIPYLWCKSNLETSKTLMPNLCGNAIQDAGGQLPKDVEHNLIWSASSMLGGGLDTNTSAALSFMRAMIVHPEIQKKAQIELDMIVGNERLPLISDMPNLPYVRSIMAETLRWAPSVPLGIPHSVSEDDVYEGWNIPKGSIVLPNIWHMLHDPEVYPDPMTFNPERFNGDDTAMDNARELAFGFGRRICPGMYLAEGTLFAIIATMLATCDILPGLDKEGKEVLPEYAYTGGIVVMPEPFHMRLRARSPQALALLAEATSAHVE